MKFDVSQIIGDYVRTLRGEKLSALSAFDLAVAFGIPTLASIGSYWFSSSVDSNLYLSLFTLLGIFVAVFMAVLGVLVPLFHAPRKNSTDSVVDNRLNNEHKKRIKLISETSNILVYLMLISIIGMSIMIIPIATKSDLFLFKWISVFVGVHLIINLLIVMKRIHALFQYEFSRH
jgi:hypothetical protein